jgi:hypothetical protein
MDGAATLPALFGHCEPCPVAVGCVWMDSNGPWAGRVVLGYGRISVGARAGHHHSSRSGMLPRWIASRFSHRPRLRTLHLLSPLVPDDRHDAARVCAHVLV